MLRPWIKFSSTGKMERKRKNEREGKARGDQGCHRVRGGGGGTQDLEDMGLRLLGPPGGASTHHVTQPQCQPLPVSAIHTTGPMLRAELRAQPFRIDQAPQTQPKSSQTKEF